ncbi:hypothetical protein HXX76_002130 [Chlamydomonas incerta]|uniref:Uncharacterized protein n=1 Tax=Chlamydomonas incerta TaxID=51695 RepID=A0A835WAH7_CHLIN|nr:hypothetical protein HXX76_002130 [Chlamydomonas incerta]|eukprot:KAG2443787.1 hypothetical protein HXX76_002130 [Chlamydomonas incerta]
MPPKTFWREDVSKLLKEQQVSIAAGLEPPPHAKTIFKLVGVVPNSRRAKSLFHAIEYELGSVYRQIDAVDGHGGLLGFANSTDAVLKENLAVLASNQLPVAIAVVKAWNLNPRTIPRKHGPKIQYDYFCISDLRNIPATRTVAAEYATAGVRHARPAPPSPGGGATAADPRPPAAATTAAQTPVEPEMTLAERETANLADSVAEQQAALRRSVGLGSYAVAATGAPRQSLSVVQAPVKGPAGLGLHGSGVGGSEPQQAEPDSALTLYMVVEVTPRGQVRALHRSDAVYDCGSVYSQAGVSFEEGGLHGFPCLDEAVGAEPPQLMERSRLPLAVAELRAWGSQAAGHSGAAARAAAPVAAAAPPGQRLGLQFARVARLHEVPPELCMDMPAILLWRAKH